MARRFSLWCTALILLTTLASLGTAGCGGGSGASGGATSQGGFGSLTIRVSPQQGPARARLEGQEIVLEASALAQRLVLEFYRLPLSGSPPTPTLVRTIDLADGQTTAVLDGVPAPAHYRVEGRMYSGADPLYVWSFVVEDVEVLPGVVATATTHVTPRPSTSPGPGPGSGFRVASTALPGSEPRVAVGSDGRSVVTWISGNNVYARGFTGMVSPTPLWTEQVLSSPGPIARAPFPALDSLGRFGVAWVDTLIPTYNIRAAFGDLATGSTLSGVLTAASLASAGSLDSPSLGMAGGTAQAAVGWCDLSLATASVLSRTLPLPSGLPMAAPIAVPGAVSRKLPTMAMASNGERVQVYTQDNGGGLDLAALLSDNLGATTSAFTVATGLPAGSSRPAVAMRNGWIVVAWVATATGNPTILARRFSYTPGNLAAGVSALDANPLQVSPSAPLGSRLNPDVAVDDTGNFVVVWQDWTLRDPQADVFGRTFDAKGTGRTPFQVNASTAGNCAWPSVGMDSSGRFLVCWGDQTSGEILARPYPAGYSGP